MHRICYRCQEDVEGNLYCPHCGTEQTCLSCHTPFQAEGKYCSECGVEKGQTMQASKAGQVANPKSVQITSPVTGQNPPVNQQGVGQTEPHPPQKEVEGIGSGGQSAVNTEEGQEPGTLAEGRQKDTIPASRGGSRRGERSSSSKKKRKWPIFVVLAAILAAAVAAYFLYVDQGPISPEEAVEGFVNAMDERDAEKMLSYFLPAVADEMKDHLDFDELPKHAEISFVRIVDEVYERDKMVEVEAEISVRVQEEEETGVLQFELLQMKDKWYIINAYE